MISWRWLLIPFSLIYGFIIYLRNFLYDQNFLKSKSYSIPLIVIGNIRVGGTGKTPFTEYLIRLFGTKRKIAILSRGYGRKTKGFLEVKAPNAEKYGDEPSQYKAKYPMVSVYVCEDRVYALDKLETTFDTIILDDAFQHRRVKGSQNWVLIPFQDLKKPIFPLPSGNYREGISGLQRADILLITKCPPVVSEQESLEIRKKLKLNRNQFLFFSTIHYLKPNRLTFSSNLEYTTKDKGFMNFIGETNSERDPFNNFSLGELSEINAPQSLANLKDSIELSEIDFILVFTGIANITSLKKYLGTFSAIKEYIKFSDHHVFTIKDIERIKNKFDAGIGNNQNFKRKILLTTEKDVQRIQIPVFASFILEYPIYYQPIIFQIPREQEIEICDLLDK